MSQQNHCTCCKCRQEKRTTLEYLNGVLNSGRMSPEGKAWLKKLIDEGTEESLATALRKITNALITPD